MTSISKSSWESFEACFDDFSNLSTATNECVYSPEFSCFGRKWRLKLYPGGDTNSGYDAVATFLENQSDKGIKDIQICLAIKNKDGMSKRSWISTSEGADIGPHESPTHGFGNSSQWYRSQLLEYLVNGRLTIEVKIRQNARSTLFIPENQFAKSMLKLFMDEDTSDVVIKAGGEPVRNTRKKKTTTSTSSSSAASFYAHSLILQQCSSTLGELCKQGEDSTVSIVDVKPEIFHHLLYHMYGGKISDEDLKENAEDIINAADKYGVVSLKLEAEASFVDTTAITFENAINTLLFADSKNCALIKEAVMDFIAGNREEAVKNLSFENVPGSAMKDLLTAVNRKEGKASISGSDFSLMRVNSLRLYFTKKDWMLMVLGKFWLHALSKMLKAL